ncbi:hypothetical protein BRO54_0986 [Geobacillus proteiniphilus]|uniref:Uncharacterized protein n=1 Tax=Geobacillus proteiniphilus TaxID=860353 RepID=A0A1Q5T579_9BACL|nr:hypothetical protein BRO54_0986 [Geobacillus proteiniphilus]
MMRPSYWLRKKQHLSAAKRFVYNKTERKRTDRRSERVV